MAWQILFTEGYMRAELKFLRKHPSLRQQYRKALSLLVVNPHHPSLRLHALAGRQTGLHSVAINLSYRITLELRISGQTIIPVNVGDHDDVYR